MILHLLRMRRNVNRNVFNDRKNVSATSVFKAVKGPTPNFVCLLLQSVSNMPGDRLNQTQEVTCTSQEHGRTFSRTP